LARRNAPHWAARLAALALAVLVAACGVPRAAAPTATAAVLAASGATPTAPPGPVATPVAAPATAAAAPAPTAVRAAASVAPVVAAPTGGPRHLFLVVMENREYDQVIGSGRAPYVDQLARDYAQADAFYAVAHPSLPNYLALIAGQTFGLREDCTACVFDAPTLADQLEARGKSWRSYQEDLPGPCFRGATAGRYALKHDPFLYFHPIRDDAARCADVVPLSRLGADLAAGRAPDLAFVAPNLADDMHDGSTAEGDRWLAAFVPALLASAAWRDGGVLVVTWDEGTTNKGCCGAAGGGHVPLIVASANGPRGYRAGAASNHYGLLGTIEGLWGLGRLAHAGDAGPASLADMFPRD
jgi:hypothetical protein